jgi:hypothetical protein
MICYQRIGRRTVMVFGVHTVVVGEDYETN